MGHFTLDYEDIAGEAALIKVVGEVDADHEAEIEATLDRCIRACRTRIVLDLSAVSVCVSQALGTIFNALKEMRAQGGNLVLLNPSASVSNILDLLGIRDMFPVAAHLDEAAAKLQQAAGAMLKGYLRLSRREPVSNQLARVKNDTGEEYVVLITDVSQEGLGCVYVGENPPELCARLSWMNGGTQKKHLKVMWLRNLEENVHRLGLQYC